MKENIVIFNAWNDSVRTDFYSIPVAVEYVKRNYTYKEWFEGEFSLCKILEDERGCMAECIEEIDPFTF